MHLTVIFLACAGFVLTAAPALAQRFEFERAIDVANTITLDVSTVRGKIEVSAGRDGQVVVGGAATVRVGWNVPPDAIDMARRFAANPAIEQQGQTVRLRPPADQAQRRAMTVNYRVMVPPRTTVIAVSDSGAATIRGVAGPITVRTQSGAIDVAGIGATAEVTSGSGAVAIDRVAGSLTVTTTSSGIEARGLAGDVRARTGSGAVDLMLAGGGNVDVETASGAVQIQHVQGGLRTVSQSGRTIVQGAPGSPWDITTGSGSVEASIATASGFRLDAVTGSGSVELEGASVDGSVAKRKVDGAIRGGGPLVRINARSGSISVIVARPAP